ncbi:MAG: hypothetical protein PHE50_10460, partial [Dehalococcoidales bacterium]|nr:hypothetical protein [Dehalococcoidales bacterium]
CWVGMDRYPGPPFISPRQRTQTLYHLIQFGWQNKIILSHDWTLAYIPREEDYWQKSGLLNWEFAYLFHEKLRHEHNPHGLLYIKKVVLPMLTEMGVDPDTLDNICKENPKKFLEGK